MNTRDLDIIADGHRHTAAPPTTDDLNPRALQKLLNDVPANMLPAQWRIVMIEGEGHTGVAPVCASTDRHPNPGDGWLYICCEGPYFETASERLAAYLAALLNAAPELLQTLDLAVTNTAALRRVEAVLDEVHGTSWDAATGEGAAADVRLIAEQRLAARLEAAALREQLAVLRDDLARAKDNAAFGLARWCMWPDCLNSYNADSGPAPGWMRHNRTGVLRCPQHTEGHWLDFDTYVISRPITPLKGVRALCSCAVTEELGKVPLRDVHAWWEQHVRTTTG